MERGQKSKALFFFIIFVDMINEARQAVLAFLNKNNYGYITPVDFNLFAYQAQLDVFEDYFYQYNYQINKENARQSGTDYANLKEGLEEVLDMFTETVPLLPVTGWANPQVQPFTNRWRLPGNYYLILGLYHYCTELASGATEDGDEYTLNDATADFIAAGVEVGDYVYKIDQLNNISLFNITSVNSATQLGVNWDEFNGVFHYRIVKASSSAELDKVTPSKLTQMLRSNLTAPTCSYPIYTIGQETGRAVQNTDGVGPNFQNNDGSYVSCYPQSIFQTSAGPMCRYVRYPLAPNWTFTTINNGEPVFDGNAADFQNFELPESDYQDLVIRILQYAGVSIRELEVYKFGQQIESATETTEK